MNSFNAASPAMGLVYIGLITNEKSVNGFNAASPAMGLVFNVAPKTSSFLTVSMLLRLQWV